MAFHTSVLQSAPMSSPIRMMYVRSSKKYAKAIRPAGRHRLYDRKGCLHPAPRHPDEGHPPRPLAKFLCKFVLKTPYGIGLGIPETMEMALQECGTPRILFAAAVSAVGKLFHKRGWFYTIAGYKARSIDGPCDYTLPPYNEYVVLGPAQPDETAQKMSQCLGGIKVAITDINDLEGQILGTSDPSMDRDLLVKILKDNPLGQSLEQTPIGIIRKVK